MNAYYYYYLLFIIETLHIRVTIIVELFARYAPAHKRTYRSLFIFRGASRADVI